MYEASSAKPTSTMMRVWPGAVQIDGREVAGDQLAALYPGLVLDLLGVLPHEGETLRKGVHLKVVGTDEVVGVLLGRVAHALGEHALGHEGVHGLAQHLVARDLLAEAAEAQAVHHVHQEEVTHVVGGTDPTRDDMGTLRRKGSLMARGRIAGHILRPPVRPLGDGFLAFEPERLLEALQRTKLFDYLGRIDPALGIEVGLRYIEHHGRVRAHLMHLHHVSFSQILIHCIA